MKNDELDDLLGEVARRSYNPPPPVPREAIWAGLEEARARRRGGPAALGPADEGREGEAVLEETHARRREGAGARAADELRQHTARRPLRWWGLGIAATLALGIGIGRLVERQSTPGAPAPGEPATVAEGIPVEYGSGTGLPPTSPTPLLADGGATEVADTGEQQKAVYTAGRSHQAATEATAQAARHATPGTATDPTPRIATESAPRGLPRSAAEAMSSTFRLAALEHLVRTEVLLTSFQVDAQAGRVDLALEGWARDLLSTTRLLLDSPASAEPRLEGLLRDLELVLVQIAQYPESRAPGELELIDQVLHENDVITRLRLAVPSGPVPVRS